MDDDDRIIVARSEKNRNTIQILRIPGGEVISTIDSNDSRVKRPGGISVTKDNHVIVVDLGHDCVKKYRYW